MFQLPAATTWPFRMRQRIKRAMPVALLGRYRRLRYMVPPVEPASGTMEMHLTPKMEIVRWLESHGGRLLDARRDEHAGNYVSYLYTVTKPASGASVQV